MLLNKHMYIIIYIDNIYMSNKCPPGVLCIENVTMSYLLISIMIICAIFYIVHKKEVTNEKIIIKDKPIILSTNTTDVLGDPYTAPLKNTGYNTNDVRGGIPINISTRAKDTKYTQVGILTRVNGNETILPLMGRQLFTNRDKWQFYTMSDQNNSIKLPISNNGKSCTGEYGCDNLYNGDNVYVEGYNDAFKVTMYDNNVMRYIPYL